MMNLVRWNPLHEMKQFSDEMDQFLAVHGLQRKEGRKTGWQPLVDLVETEKDFRITAELPGMKKEDIGVDVADGMLTIKGERHQTAENENANYHRIERTWGKFQRVFQLPRGVAVQDIKADYKDGVLTLDIPKPEKNVPQQITIG